MRATKKTMFDGIAIPSRDAKDVSIAGSKSSITTIKQMQYHIKESFKSIFLAFISRVIIKSIKTVDMPTTIRNLRDIPLSPIS